MKKILLSAFATVSLFFSVSAQTTVTLTATGVTGSFNTGSVNSAGTKNDGNMVTINSGANVGWAKFDLSTLPAGAVVMSANCEFTTYTSTSSGATNNLRAFIGDPAAIAGGTLYTNCTTGTSINASSWTANATNTAVVNAAGLSFLQTNIASNQLCVSYQRGSTNTYNVYGYAGTAAQLPKLIITFSVSIPCSGMPSAGTVVASNTLFCTSQNVNLTLSGSTAAAGLSYQWLSSPDGLTWNPIPTATTIATTQSVTGTTYYQCAVACGTDVATSSTLTVNFGLAPNAGVTAATSTMVCPNQPINLSLTGASTAPGLTYQWQSSANGVTYSPIVPTASLAATTQTITSSIYFQNVLTCGSATAASTPIQVMTAGTTTNNVPYFEGFEGISFNNQLPNCSWTATSPGTICLTYTATPPPTVYNRIPKSGSKFGSFRYGTATAGDYFYTNGIQLTAGVLYQASTDYITDGASGWSEFSLLYGTSQSTTGLTSIASATGALTNTTYSNLSGTFSVSATGLYHIAVKAIGNNTPWYLTFDDLKVDVAPSCLAPTAFASTGFTSSSATFSWTAGGTETSWDVFVGSTPNGTTVPTATTTTTSYTATGLSVGNTYSVYVRANCGGTNSAWVLSTVVINYCTPAPSSVDGSGITNVTIPTGINNTTTAEVGNYGNYSVQTATVFQGANVPVSITYATGYTYDTKIWIDFNDDLDFNDVGEDIYTGVSLATNPTTLIANITIPLAAPMGVHRLRIGGVDVGPPTPCYNGTYGSFEDYSINIQAAPACTLAPVAGVISGSTTVNNGTTNSYSISPVSGNVQWYTGTTATGPWSPIATATAATNQTITAVGSGTVYYTVIASAPGCVNDTANVAYPVTVIFQGDNVCNAIPLSIGTSPLYDLFGATTQTGEVVPPGTGNTTNSGWLNSNLTNSMWFTFVAPLSGNVSIQAPTSMNGGANDPQLAVWSTTNCANLIGQATPTAPVGATLVAANDDDANYTTNAGAQYSSYVRAACLTAGATYYIQLDTYSAASPGDATTIIITDLGAYNASFSGLLSNYCLPAASSSLTPANAGGVFTVNGGTTTVTSFTPTTLGTNTVTYTNQLVACVTTSTTIVANTPTVGATASSASVCVSASATLTANGATTYTWTAGGNASTEVVTPSSASVYTVTGTTSGCSNTATVSVGVTATPTVMAMTSNTAICAGSSATLTAMGATNYTWTTGGNTDNEVVTPTTDSIYMVIGETSGCSAIATVSVLVNQIPTVSAIASQTLLCDDGSTGASVLTASTSASTYSWSDGATTITTAVTPTSTTTYTVTVTELGCSADAFVTVTVSNCNGVKELIANGISVYPNPTNGVLNIAISSELAGNTSVEVYDAVGKLVIKETLSTETSTINTSKLTDGIYVFKIMNNNQAIKIGKIVKQ